MKRREFLKVGGKLAAGGALLGALGPEALGQEAWPEQATMAYRPFGSTGHNCSVLTLGGRTLVNQTQKAANRFVSRLLDAGVNQIDFTLRYGNCGPLLGRALWRKRNSVFLGCKSEKRDGPGVLAALEESLRTLNTDWFDLFSLHALDRQIQLDRALAPGGAVEALEQAREAGLIRFIGITGHSTSILEQALDRYPFDAIMFPYNFVNSLQSGWGEALLEKARQRGVAVTAIKVLRLRALAVGEAKLRPLTNYLMLFNPLRIAQAQRFVMQNPAVSTMAAISAPDLALRQLAAAPDTRPLAPDELQYLQNLATSLPPQA